jgi:glutamate-ammonia-ligase adenylyltransferase
MRGRIGEAHRAASPWDVKYIAGGLVDVEFIAQYLQLRHAAEKPEVLDTNTNRALDKLGGAGLIDSDTAKMLAEGGKLWRTIQGMLRFTVEGTFDEETATTGLKAALMQATGMDDFQDLKDHMAETAKQIRAAFIDLVGDPDAAPDSQSPKDDR